MIPVGFPEPLSLPVLHPAGVALLGFGAEEPPPPGPQLPHTACPGSWPKSCLGVSRVPFLSPPVLGKKNAALLLAVYIVRHKICKAWKKNKVLYSV